MIKLNKEMIFKYLIVTVLLLILFGLAFYIIKTKMHKEEFEVRVKEAYNSFALAEPISDEIKEKHPIIELDIANLKEGDIVKITTSGEYLETYPPKVVIQKYEFVINNSELPSKIKDKDKTLETSSNEENNSAQVKNTTTTTTTKPVINNNVKTTTTIKTTTTKKAVVLSKDSIVLTNLENKIKGIKNNQNNDGFKTKAKEYFVKVIDFIFYDKDIDGVYFKDLTNKTKLKVIELTLKLDNLIEKHYPNYKDELSSSYQNIKTKLVTLYLNKTSEYCQKNDDVCEMAKEDFKLMKNSYNITWEFIKNITSEGLSKLKEWYEIYSAK